MRRAFDDVEPPARTRWEMPVTGPRNAASQNSLAAQFVNHEVSKVGPLGHFAIPRQLFDHLRKDVSEFFAPGALPTALRGHEGEKQR